MNYQKELEKIIASIPSEFPDKKKPTLLLHACCGPCSSYVLEYLAKHFDITVYYYNPNIYPEEEYHRRLDELKTLYPKFPPALENKIKVVEETYNPEDFYNAVNTKNEPELCDEPEKGERCRRCYEFRLKMCYKFAKNHGFNYFCTTLSISPFKDAEKINKIGMELTLNDREHCVISRALDRGDSGEKCHSDRSGGILLEKMSRQARHDRVDYVRHDREDYARHDTPRWLFSDFKKKGGFKRSLELSDEYDLYRQDYCGCVYSWKSRQNHDILKP